ncbi:general transcription factor II-I repeat domain-containing protein 2A-like [Cardiocondyla obscurior]|uniref:general transcription factor II-I repeat domain-containing protein 2A-like n=1 Tax=Cardiocondyla obscurior TaxID=286306 RepID=UPI003965673E
MGNFLGDMTDELESYGCGSYITSFVSGGPKFYSHYHQKHLSEYVKYQGVEKSNLIESLKLVYQEGCSSNSSIDNATPSRKALTASYAISHLIAQNFKPFSEGTFIKECLLAAVNSFGSSLTFEEAVNESTDNRHVSQLSILAQIVQNDFSHVEELLDFVPLHNTTTGIDIFEAVNQTLNKFEIDFSKCSAVITDSAKAIIGSKKEFSGQIKQRGLKLPVIHCIIHQEALCGKAIKLSTAMQMVTKIINTIKGGQKFLSHRKFQLFLQEHNAVYSDVPLYCETRWLSAGKCLETFFAIRKEIFLFLQESPKLEKFKIFLEDLDSLCELALITDLTGHLNKLNLKLQKTD